MIYCVNPTCIEPQNIDTAKTCHSCGSFLQLRDRYSPRQLLGKGGSGRTFLALDQHSAHPSTPFCVLKQIPLEQRTESQIHQMVQRLEAISYYPHLPDFIDAFLERNYHYVVHEWVDGESLASELAQSGAFDEGQIWQVLQDGLAALNALHAHDLIHRDIKPENLIRRTDGSLILVDLGSVAIASIPSLQTASGQIGSPEYAAPEQISNSPVFASDLYSLGVTCLHLLTTLSPFELFDDVSGGWVWQDYLPHPVSDALIQVLNQLVQPLSEKRFASAEAAIASLQSVRGLGLSPSSKLSPPLVDPVISFASGHTGSINAIALHSTRSIFATGSDDKTIRLWERDSQNLIAVLSGHQGSVRAIAFSPSDDALLTSASDDKTIGLWNWQTQTQLTRLHGHQASVRSLCFSPDGTYLFSGSWDKTIGIWHVATATQIATWKGHTLQINAISLNTEGTWLASASEDRTARLWQLQPSDAGVSATLQSVLVDHTWAVTAVAFSPDGRLVATGSNDNTVKLWQTESGQLLYTLSGHSWVVAALQFSPDGQYLFSASWDKTIKRWQVETQEDVTVLAGHSDAIYALGIFPHLPRLTSDASVPTYPDHLNWVISSGQDRQINMWHV